MAINQPAKKEDAWDKVAKALTIANQGVGIVGGIQSIRKSSNDMDIANAGQERIKNGIMTPEEQLKHSKEYNQSDTQTPGSFPMVTPQGKTVFMAPKSKAPDDPAMTAALTQKDLNSWEQGGGKVVPAGTHGSRLSSVLGPDGKIEKVGLVKPTFSDPNAAKAPLSEDDRKAKLSGTDKQRYDNVVMANDAIADMGKSLSAGGSRYSLIGDNDYTAGLARFDEALGRMQSGGAISKDEQKSFMNLARNLGDDPRMQIQKLQKLQGIMKDRYQTLGFDPSKNERFAYNIDGPKKQGPSEMVGGAVATDSAATTRIVNGAVYKKAKGGWQKQ